MDWPGIELGPPWITQVIFQDAARTAQSKFRVGYKKTCRAVASFPPKAPLIL